MSGDDERAADTVEEMIKKQLEKKGEEPKMTRAFARSPKQPQLRTCSKSAKSFVFWR